VNAVYDGTFANAENNGAPAGWTMSNNTLGGDYHARALVSDDRLTEFNETNSAFFLRFDHTNSDEGSMYFYGRTTGYTMPLKANTYYLVTVDFAGWGSTGNPLRINVSGPEGFEAVSQHENTSYNADSESGYTPQQFSIYFKTAAAGNYEISFQNPGASKKHNVVISNVTLKTAAEINTVYLAGSFNDWNTTASEMEKVGDYSYSCVVDLTNDNKDVEFKPVVNGTHISYSEFTMDESNPEGWLVEEDVDNHDNIKLMNSATCYKTYRITATWEPSYKATDGWTLKVEGVEYKDAVLSWGITNDPSWTNVNLVKDEESYTYTGTLDLSEVYTDKQFQLVVNNDWKGQDEITVIAPEGFITAGPSVGDDITLNHASTHFGTYNVTATWDSSTNHWTVEIAGAAAATETFNVTDAGWATANTRHPVDFTETEGLEAYIATLSGTTVILTKATQVPAETPIVLKGKTAKATIVYNEVPAVVNNALTWYNEYTVNDSYAHIYALTIEGDDGLAKFARVNHGVTFHNKAVIELINGSGARELRIVFAGESTGINAVAAEEGANRIYNMNGQRVSAPAKGLYIVDGKKVVMK
jgi:hypothetical protein